MTEGGVEHNMEWTPSCTRRYRFKYEDESKETSNLMNLLGYGSGLRQRRINAYRKLDSLRNARFTNDVTTITAGSKAEGLTCFFESDMDTMFIIPHVVCLDVGINEETIPSHIIVFTMGTKGHNAGYCKLQQGRLTSTYCPAISNALCIDGCGNVLLSSTQFVDFFRHNPYPSEIQQHARAGPSLPWSFGPMAHDVVRAIRVYCPGILQNWAKRCRYWPPPDIVENVIVLGAFVNPIGFKGSEHYHVEWRICFNTGETELVNNLNDTQIKIYVLLKMIVKDILKPRKKVITSYILKNIVLWLAENNPQELFHSGSIFHWLKEGLISLRTAISSRQLPYYMIPERNLMAERDLVSGQQDELVKSLTCLIDEGPKILRRLKKIRQAIIGHKEPLLWYSKLRIEFEILYLELSIRQMQCKDENGVVNTSDIILLILCYGMMEVLNKIIARMHSEGTYLNDITQLIGMILG
ncbi:uncharacterized protein LOC127866977 isoform X1 [Dreissena polymorpha]|uniref:Mab-21-like HhH/H2TH-like domain-containing protein n=1 Tax=Dreissena polymorpha TaxID=45954 RepID=A0A9D4LTS8_DREPO|nr:uncharacterized protein LOC127866977 isoform X1 [Dreissena polymorpha]XP_052263830.1 uncharacterized protein LOC127866977 isoform X1 [Dreissena polymorpha]KAH3864907.1 hypothetical protein DPMN_027940 [Dreissena polymorpha]